MYESADLTPPLQGPQPLGVVVTSDNATLTITFDAELEPVLREEERFMICCLASMDQCDSHHYNEAHHFIYCMFNTDNFGQILAAMFLSTN